MFSVFEVLRNKVFSGIAFRGALGDDTYFLAYFGLRWGTHLRYFGHQGALIYGRNCRRILGGKMMDFWDLPQAREMVAAVAAGLARGKKLILYHDIWYHAA